MCTIIAYQYCFLSFYTAPLSLCRMSRLLLYIYSSSYIYTPLFCTSHRLLSYYIIHTHCKKAHSRIFLFSVPFVLLIPPCTALLPRPLFSKSPLPSSLSLSLLLRSHLRVPYHKSCAVALASGFLRPFPYHRYLSPAPLPQPRPLCEALSADRLNPG